MNKTRDGLRVVTRHAQAGLFCGNGSSELLVYLPPFATSEHRMEFGKRLRTLAESINRPFVQSSAEATPMSLKVHADDEETLRSLAGARAAFGSDAAGNA